MTKTSEDALPWLERRSPSGRFQVWQQDLSVALGARRDVGEWGGGHPFDVASVRIPPGALNFPYHAHSAQWEVYLIQAGTGEIRTPTGWEPIAPGTALCCPPGEPHQIRNSGATDLVYYVIADHARADVIEYPDSGKWMIKPQRHVFTANACNYYDGEEPGPASSVAAG